MGVVGVLALQGGFEAHARALARLGHGVVEVRAASDLDALDGLVLPGGESTTQLKLIARWGLGGPLEEFVRSGRPVLATCAGLILAARAVTNPEQRCFGWLDVEVARNAWGRQLDSFEAVSDDGLPLVFIRAPRIRGLGRDVECLARLAGEPILVRQKNVTGAAFHPELTDDVGVHAAVFGTDESEADLDGLARRRSTSVGGL
jgi:pyridoxal 5'-phosphate synthase pdxT subunit